MIAFKDFNKIQKLKTNEQKQREWLKGYEGLHFSIGKDKQDLVYWKQDKDKYIYSDKLWEGWYCESWKGDFLYAQNINKIQRHKQRLVIEFDNETNAQTFLEQVYKRLKKNKWGFIRSTHKGKCDYLWIEFTRELTSKEAENFLGEIAPEGSKIDMNFPNDNFRFPVLFAEHWKYKGKTETPTEYFEGKQINYDELNLKDIEIKTKIVNGYKTYVKEQPIAHEGDLDIRTITDYKNLKIDKNYIVETFLYPKTLNMIALLLQIL